MDTDPDAPPDSTLDEQRPKGTPEHELASFGPDSPEAPEPEEPEEEKNATAEAERPVRVTESAAATPSTQTSREIGPDSAAAPVSPPASDRNATTSAQVKTSHSPTAPNRPRPKASIPTLFPGRPIPAARRSASARNRADQRRHHGCRRAHRRLPTSRDTIPTPNPRSAGGSTALSPAIPSEPLRRQEHPGHASRTAGPNPRRATRLHTLRGKSRSDRVDERHASPDDKRRGLAGRAPGQADHFHRRTHAAAA